METLALDPKRTRGRAVIQQGDVFAERYVVERLLGSGAMGLVFLVRDTASSTCRALKVLKPEFYMDESAKLRFDREIRILARLSHPCIPRVVDWGSSGDLMFFVSEWVPGQNLADVLVEQGPLPIQDALSMVCGVADPLSCAHQAGVIHRDLKPSNIMVSPDGYAKLIDFGVAMMVQAEWSKLTKTGHLVGTPQFMAPEQFTGGKIDERADVYSLGVILFAALVGKLPFAGRSAVAIAVKQMKTKPPSPKSLRPEIPASLDRLVLRCLEKDLDRRFRSASHLAASLKEEASHQDRGGRCPSLEATWPIPVSGLDEFEN